MNSTWVEGLETEARLQGVEYFEAWLGKEEWREVPLVSYRIKVDFFPSLL